MKPSSDAPSLPLAPGRAAVSANVATVDTAVPARMLDVARKASPQTLEGFKTPRFPELRNRHDSSSHDVSVRVSVIDGNDRMVYSDVRERRGWAQPLAVNEALREASRGQGGREVPSSSPPRVIHELEQRRSSVPIESRQMPGAASPYQAGKSNVRSRSATASSQPAATAAKERSASRAPAVATKTR